jgi:hypothetical protein
MPNILDQVARTRGEFRPETTQEFFALQLARKLNDAASVRSYLELTERFSEDFLLSVYRTTLDQGKGNGMSERFRVELRRRSHEEAL